MLNSQKHKIKMLQILKEVYADVAISSYLGFKGGTACYFFYDLPRFSVDLDFDLLDGSKKQIVFERMLKILEKFGTVKDKTIKRNTIFFLLSYGDLEQNIKIEISTRELKNNFEVLNYFGLSVQVMKKEDIFANKLVALCGREKVVSRDIFDIHFFFDRGWDINEEIIEFWTKKKMSEYLRDCIEVIEKIPDNKILQGIGQLISEKQKTWVRNEMKKEVLLFLNAMVSDEK